MRVCLSGLASYRGRRPLPSAATVCTDGAGAASDPPKFEQRASRCAIAIVRFLRDRARPASAPETSRRVAYSRRSHAAAPRWARRLLPGNPRDNHDAHAGHEGCEVFNYSYLRGSVAMRPLVACGRETLYTSMTTH